MNDATDILVIGGGLAGLAAARQAALLGRRCSALLGEVPGGQLLNIGLVEGLPGHEEGLPGYDLCPIAQEQAEAAGAACVTGEVSALVPGDGGWQATTPSGDYHAKTVILATGAELARLGVPGEAEFANRGVGHCASCDAPLLRGKRVAVVGGGDAACQEGLVLAEHAAQVLLLHRGPDLAAQAAWRTRVAAAGNLACRAGCEVEAILGDDAVRALRVAVGGDTEEIPVDAVYAYVGLVPNTTLVADHAALDARGAVLTDSALRCRARGLFAAGSVRAANSGQAVGAAADGIQAAFAADTFLRTGDWPAAC